MDEPILTEAQVWEPLFVADTYDQARYQAARQFGMVDMKLVRVTRISGQIRDEGWMEWELKPPGVVVRVVDVFEDPEWDWDEGAQDGTMIPEWRCNTVGAEDEIVETIDGEKIRMWDIDYLGYTAPGIGTANGFAHRDPSRLVYPPVHSPVGPITRQDIEDVWDTVQAMGAVDIDLPTFVEPQ